MHNIGPLYRGRECVCGEGGGGVNHVFFIYVKYLSVSQGTDGGLELWKQQIQSSR